VLEPYSHVIPGHGLTADHWRTWRALAGARRPGRALRSLWRACLELVGARKHTELFLETFRRGGAARSAPGDPRSSDRRRIEAAPLEGFLNRSTDRTPPMHAAVRLLDAPPSARPGATIVIALEIRNNGSAVWIADPSTRGYVRIGAQLLDAGHRLIDRGLRAPAAAARLAAGAMIHAVLSCDAPPQPGAYFMKIDLVSEGVTWFEPLGSTPAVHRFDVE